jgi:phytoene desaturase
MRAEAVGVVGGGLGGLAAACTLAARGYRVQLFERNPWLGGKAAVLQSDGYRFDMGPTILTVPSVLRRIVGEAGRELEDEIELLPLEPQWRCFFGDGATLDLVADTDQMATALEVFAPERQLPEGYRAFMEFAARNHEIADRYFFWRPAESMRGVLADAHVSLLSQVADVWRMHPWQTVAGAVRGHLKDPRVAQMADHFTQYIGSSPYQAPALLCGIAHMQTDEGIWYPRGGIGEVPRMLSRLAEELGVEWQTATGVAEIVLDGGRVTGVRTDDGREAAFGAVVSNCDAALTYGALMEHPGAEEIKSRWSERACSGLVLYLGLDRRYDHLLHHGFVFSRDPEQEFDAIYGRAEPAQDPSCYVCAPSRSDTTAAPEGCEALYVLVHTPYLRRAHDWTQMLPDYRRVVFDKLERTGGLEDLESHVVFEHVLTPEGIRDRYGSPAGAIYGFASHGKVSGAFKPSNRRQDVEGLYLAGGSAHPGPGMPMAMMSGWIAADALDRDGVVQTAR